MSISRLPDPVEFVSGLLLSVVIGIVGYRRGALTGSGMVGGFVSGTLIFGLGGWEWGLLLLGFFISSSLFSHYRAGEKATLAEKFAKGYRRDLGQAMANAGVGMGLAVVHLWWPHSLLYIACAGAMAAVNADTWATEVGVLSRRPPRLITTGQPVEAGASGGVTALGLAMSMAGATLIGLLGAGAALAVKEGLMVASAVAAGAVTGGLAGSLSDSLLGATLQAIYWCDRCGKETERRVHRCGAVTRQMRGLSWLGNDGVNFIASAIGGAVAMAVGAALLAGR
jgi:uncharacterized protein (TIGR00297 family)